MFSYLHGYHAGNAADVLKHSALLFCLDYLKKKEKPLLCVDTHAGAGFYDLSNREWERGIGRLREAAGEQPPMIAGYVKSSDGKRYPGSSVIMARALSGGDRLVCCELHPQEFEALEASMEELRGRGGPTIEPRREDGPGGLKSLLPPPSRRGLVFIDPPWEEQSENESIPRSVLDGLRRFPEGTFIIWYPLLSLPKVADNGPSPREALFALSGKRRCRAELGAPSEKLKHGTENSPRGMYGSGLLIYNPPWTLKSALEEALPFLASALYDDERAWRLDWED